MARVAFKIGDIVGKFTEFLDVVDAAYDAIPGKAFNPKDRVFYRGRDVTGMKQKMELVYRHADDIQLDQFVKNLLWQHVQDEALGRFMGQAEKGLGKNRLRGVSRLSRLGTVAG